MAEIKFCMGKPFELKLNIAFVFTSFKGLFISILLLLAGFLSSHPRLKFENPRAF